MLSLISKNILGLWASIYTALDLLTLVFYVLSSLGLFWNTPAMY